MSTSLTPQNAGAFAHSLLASDETLAFLEWKGRLYFARHRPSSPFEPTSAVVKLIQGIYAHDPLHAREIVRKRIFSTAHATEMCLGMVKVAAKRLTAGIVPEADPRITVPEERERIDLSAFANPYRRDPVEPPWLQAPPSAKDGDFIALARELARTVPRSLELHASSRPVACLLVSENGEILSWSVNTNASNRTLHAEVNLLQEHFARTGAPLPRRSRIYVSLKCCKMCAAMIWKSAEDIRTFRVIYGENDPGPNARSTVLTPGGFERKRAAGGDSELLHCRIEEELDGR